MAGSNKVTSPRRPARTSRLSTRLTRSIVLTGIILFLSVSVLVSVLLASYTRSLGRLDSQAFLTEVHYYLDLQAGELDSLVMVLADRAATSDELVTSIEELADTGCLWVTDPALASTVVWTDGNGAVLTASGSDADAEVLRKIALQNAEGVHGPAMLPSGPVVVSVRPVAEESARTGTIAVARRISTDGLVDGNLRTAQILPVDSTDPLAGWRELEGTPPYTAAATLISDGTLKTRGVLPAINASPALLVELSRPDPWVGDGRLAIVLLTPLVLGTLIIGTSYLLAMALGRGIERPLHQFVNYLQDQGYLALQGLRTDDEVLIEPDLPADFAQLGNVITDLMTQLRINQAELFEAGDQALAAEMAFRTVVEESPEVKILVRGGVVEIANPAAAHFFGLQLGDLLRAEPDGLFSGIQLFDENDSQLELLKVAREAHDAPVVARCVSPDQPDRWIELSVAFIDYEGDDYVISARNITEERRLEALRAEVLSLVSHDLRSPLTVVCGYLDILDKQLDEERRGTAVQGARKAALRMEGLLDDLLHATRAERVFAPKVMRPVDLSALVEGIAASLAMGATQTVAHSLEPGVTVLGDPVRLEQAIANLVGNAIKHGPPEGEVRVAVHVADGKATVSVEDDGEGIPEDQQERVFERGARTEAAQGTPGLGLGLYIVRVVAEAHGGSAFVDPDASCTRFVLELPVMQPEFEMP